MKIRLPKALGAGRYFFGQAPNLFKQTLFDQGRKTLSLSLSLRIPKKSFKVSNLHVNFMAGNAHTLLFYATRKLATGHATN